MNTFGHVSHMPFPQVLSVMVLTVSFFFFFFYLTLTSPLYMLYR